MPKLEIDLLNWTYGVEHELADWDTRDGWDGYGIDPEPNIVNSNGIAADPLRISYPFGGEINTPPTTSRREQAVLLTDFLKRHPRATVNYRTGMHVHIRVPGLSTSLTYLKKLQEFITDNADVYNLVDPIPIPKGPAGERRRAQWMRMSHHTVIPRNRVARQLNAKTLTEFFELEVPRSKAGQVLWHAQPRAAINLRQLKQTDTIEFRHFVGTLDPAEVSVAVEWCHDYMMVALTGGSAERLFQTQYARLKFPRLSDYPYNQDWEDTWQRTTISKNKRPEIDAAIAEVLDHPDYPRRLRWLDHRRKKKPQAG